MIKKLLLNTLVSFHIFCPAEAMAQYMEGNTRAWGNIEYKGTPWVSRTSRPNNITEGLLGRHISLWASHGRYYDANKNIWKWQRPNLFCTTEDLFTQTIVVPFLIPMLENAGACVFTPRERDWQVNEIIVDGDNAQSGYIENNDSKSWKDCDSTGFAKPQGLLSDGENPFSNGHVRQAKATKKNTKNSFISYQPYFAEEGRYAVYVSYASLPKSVSDAKYTVWHKGIATEFTVNQRMGGGTWVYLGTFDFDKGSSDGNRVVITNHSAKRGIVTSDAVRFGGGMGNIMRRGNTSHLPRCLEGARYYAQWAGMPYSIYGGREGKNDYADDINVRSLMTNHLAGGSCYAPLRSGLNVPIELALAIHSDAGYDKNDAIVGSLAVCTTNFNDEELGCGISRMTSKDFAEALLNNFTTDMQRRYYRWQKRYLWDKNYSETRIPDIPSAILETLSHQNFADVRIAQNPTAKFYMARSIYKTILRYISTNHGAAYTVQPLPPKCFSVSIRDGKAYLSWKAQNDPDEQSAKATSYNVYISAGDEGFSNGTNVSTQGATIDMIPGKQYNFYVTACNEGGESMPSETLSAFYVAPQNKKILVVNNFHRLASPQVVSNDTIQGFDIDKDPGVSYGLTAGWNGRQIDFNRKQIGKEGPGGLGYSGDELAGQFIMGNTFDYPVSHTNAIASANRYNVVSCSSEAILNGSVSLTDYDAVDLIIGQERNDGYTPEPYKSFTPKMQELIKAYTSQGGSILVSGNYIGSDMSKPSEKEFLKNVLNVEYAEYIRTDSDSIFRDDFINGLGISFTIYDKLNPVHYAVNHPETLQPVGNAICTMQYTDGGSAAVGCKKNKGGTFVMGFPFECIRSEYDRRSLMRGILEYLLKEE